MNPLAIELNQLLSDTPAAELLSGMGKRLYFPKGIIAQSAEAKSLGKRANATIGTARKDGKPLMLSSVKEQLPGLSPAESVAYAPTAGVPELRELYEEKTEETERKWQAQRSRLLFIWRRFQWIYPHLAV